VRRRAVVPGFHKKWLNNMIVLFGDCGSRLVANLEASAASGTPLEMEERFCSVTLDIIGRAVFNYDFGSVTKESPIVKAVYRVLREAEHRSSSFIPYWNLPYADKWMGGQVEFRKDMDMLDTILTKLINRAVETRREASVEELEDRDVGDDPSLLRFLADMRGEDLTSKVLRDDLMTMLIAGHETTAVRNMSLCLPSLSLSLSLSLELMFVSIRGNVTPPPLHRRCSRGRCSDSLAATPALRGRSPRRFGPSWGTRTDRTTKT
jgi:cytochrome P450